MTSMTDTTSTLTTDRITAAVDTHLAAYGEPDPARRRRLVEETWAASGELIDPPIGGAGHDGIDGVFAAVQSHFPGHTFRRTTDVDTHHGVARYGWQLVGADGTVALAGMDVADLDAEGLLVRVTGFFGDLAPVAG